MDPYLAVLIVEGICAPATHRELVDAWQQLIDTGIAANPSFAQEARHMIDAGYCLPNPELDI